MSTIIFKNEFGQITEKTLSIRRKNGSEDIAINQITSISLKSKRNYIGLIIGVAILIWGFIIQTNWLNSEFNRSGISVEALILWILGILIFLSNWLLLDHTLIISVSGIERPPIRFSHSKKTEGIAFADAIKKCIG